MSHPIVEQMNPSHKQRPAVEARNGNVAVTAGAGTGKTRTLVARYLSLLAEGLPLRSILAITFTRKAAWEMRNRVRQEIRRYLQDSDLESKEYDHWQDLQRQLDAARIGTIHSFCTEILRSHPAEAQVDPRFEVLAEGQGHLMLAQAVDEALSWAADDQETVVLFGLWGDQGLRTLLEGLLNKRLDVSQAFDHLPQQLWPVWEPKIVPHILKFVDAEPVRDAFGQLRALRADGTLDRAADANDALAEPLRCLLKIWDELLDARQQDDWAAVSIRLSPLRDAMKQRGRAANWEPANPRSTIKLLQTLYDDSLADWVGKGINLDLDRALAQHMPDLYNLFLTGQAVYDRLKRERQALDFDDLEQRALSLLQDNQAVKDHWQAEIEAILVDEFQDTNERQRDLVRCLDGPQPKLFIVGDAKQSIYRFRGADVALFRKERKSIEEEGTAIQLDTSYRAHQELIAALNAMLEPVLGSEADPVRPWVEPFTALSHAREDPGPGFEKPHIELHLTAGSKSSGALDRAAYALAIRLIDLVEGGLQIEEGKGYFRPLNYGDVAVLCRASSSFGPYEDAFEAAGLPYLTVAGRGFYARPEIRDILNALQALADPSDDLALAGLLRSPAFCLSDETLFHLCQRRDSRDQPHSLWKQLKDAPGPLPLEDSARAARATDIIDRLAGLVGRTSVADVLKAFLDATDYRALLLQAGDVRAARNVSKLLADAQASAAVGVGEFLEYVDNLREAGTREGEARATAEGAIQIMSVHGAKGLEFPVVVIGDASYGGGGGGSTVLLDPVFGLLLGLKENGASPAGYQLGLRRIKDQDAAESDRLLYVAATRAREKLILNGLISLKKDGSPGKQGGWVGRLAVPLKLTQQTVTNSEEGDQALPLALSLDLGKEKIPVAGTLYEPRWGSEDRHSVVEPESVQAAVLPPPLLAPVQAADIVVDEQTIKQERRPPQRVWRVVPAVPHPTAPAWVVGSIVHEALSLWRFPDQANQNQGFAAWAEARARGYGLTDQQRLNRAIALSQTILRRFQGEELYQLMSRADRRLHEVPYSREANGKVENGIIDAMFLKDGQWTVVEFKTDRVDSQADFHKMLETKDYKEQTRRYLDAAEALLGQRPHCVLCMLNMEKSVRVINDFVA